MLLRIKDESGREYTISLWAYLLMAFINGFISAMCSQRKRRSES